MLVSFVSISQTTIADDLRPNPEKEKKFGVYLAMIHGGLENIEKWKQENTLLYYKELWYYCESFYVKRNYYDTGETMNDAMIDIGRFERNRKIDTEAIVTIPGFRDVLVLLPTNKLIYKP